MKTIYSISSFAIAFLFLMSSCNTGYISPQFDETTEEHKMVAVLPYELVYTGRLPKDISEEQIIAIEENESILFQSSLYNQILRRSANSKKKKLNVDLQNFNETNNILANANITIHESWRMTAAELADILGVDAVIRTSVRKRQYLNNLESALVTAGTEILEEVVLGSSIFTGDLNRTSDVDFSCTIIDKDLTSTLWSISRQCSTDFRTEPEEAVDNINRNISRYFPYRKKVS